MGKCICCGAVTPGNYKLCRKCDDLARHNPCIECSSDQGRSSACQLPGICGRRAAWLKANDAFKKLVREQKEIFRNFK